VIDKLKYTNGCAYFLDGHKEEISLAIILCHNIYFFTESGKYVYGEFREIYGLRDGFVPRPNCNFLKCIVVSPDFDEMRVVEEYDFAPIDYIDIFKDGKLLRKDCKW